MHEFIFMQRDVDSAVSTVGQSEPFLIITGHPGDEGSRVFISCEREIFVSSKSVIDGMLDLMAIYFFCHHLSQVYEFRSSIYPALCL